MTRSTGCSRGSERGMPGSTDSTRTYAAKETSMSDSIPVTAPDQEVLITRIFDAPREQVFKAWTDPDEVAAWYGPEHMDVPREKVRIDLRVGGRWELTMVQRGGGTKFAIWHGIVALVAPELIIMRPDPVPQA